MGKRNNLPNRLVRRVGSRSVTSLGPSNIFNSELLSVSSRSQTDLLLNMNELNNKVIKTITISQRDFVDGTLRITEPGKYVLTENIEFNPQNQFPRKDQLEKYPVGRNGAYHLGFFAAITIECDNVILDLKNYTIRQSKRHNLLQRFFSIIELANSPFIPKQGPHKFVENYKPANKCLIMNGVLDNSSHHGIHGNSNSNIVIENVRITGFEVAGVALNGAINCVICNCDMIGKKTDIRVMSSFSQALFTSRALENLNETESDVYKNVVADLEKCYNEIMYNKEQTTYFENKTKQYDGNMYGIVLNVNGVVINDFLKERKEEQKNDDILIHRVSIKDIESHPIEIVGIGIKKDQESPINAYGGKQMVGVFGDVFDVEKVMSLDNKYKNGNSLSESQLYIAEKYPTHGTINIDKDVIEWARSKEKKLKNKIYTSRGDSMGHIMKGNIGLFISGGKRVTVSNLNIDNVKTNGENLGSSRLLKEEDRYFDGSNAYGILCTATKSEEVVVRNVRIENVVAVNKGSINKNIEIL